MSATGSPNLVRSSAQIALISLIAGVLSFVNQAVIARLFGSGPEMTAYVVGTSVPLFGAGLAGALVTYSIVPVLIHHGQDPNERRALEGRLFWILAGICALVAALGGLLAPAIIHATAPDLAEPRVAFHSALLAWGSFVTITLTSFNAAVWNARGVYVKPAFAALCPTLGAVIGAVVFGRSLGPVAVAAGVLGGSAIGCASLAIGATLTIVASETAGKHALEALQRTPLVLCSIAVFSLYGTSDSFFASRLGNGAVGYLAYSQRIVVGLGALVTAAPLMIMLPILSQLNVEQNEPEFRRMAGRAIRSVLALSAGIAVILAQLRVPAISILLERGKFSHSDTQAMSEVFLWIALGMAPMLTASVAFQALYAKRDWPSAAKIGLVGSLGYLALSAALPAQLGIAGFGIAYMANWSLVLALSCAGVWGFRGFAARVFSQGPFVQEVGPGLIGAYLLCYAASRIPADSGKASAVAQLLVGVIAFGLYLAICRMMAPRGHIAALLGGLSSKFRKTAVAS